MKNHILLFEDWKVKTFNIQDYWPNAEEMKEIEKVKKYFIWWYSHSDVISKIKSKERKNISKKFGNIWGKKNLENLGKKKIAGKTKKKN